MLCSKIYVATPKYGSYADSDESRGIRGAVRIYARIYYGYLISRNLRRFLVASDVLEIDAVVLQAARVVIIRVIIIVLLARFRSHCRAAAAAAG